jgi:hypothetical protein
MKKRHLLSMVLAGVFAWCASVAQSHAEPATKTGKAGNYSPEPYTRFEKIAPDTYALKLAVRTFTLPDWVTAQDENDSEEDVAEPLRVTLISAIHIGSADYYRQLQRILDDGELLLYEGVGDSRRSARGAIPRRKTAALSAAKTSKPIGANPAKTSRKSASAQKAGKKPAAARSSNAADDGDFYTLVANACGLVTQTTAVRYNRKHFRNADMSISEMWQLLDKEIKSGGKKGTEAQEAKKLMTGVMDMLSGAGGFEAFLMRGLLSMVKTSPQLQNLFLLHLGNSTRDITAGEEGGSWAERVMASAPGMKRMWRLMLDDRNSAALAALREEIKLGRAADIGIFYGAAHMRGIEQELVAKFGAKPVETRWLTAFVVRPQAAGVPAFLVRKFTEN